MIIGTSNDPPDPPSQVPTWLWRSTVWGFVALLVAIAGLAAALALGAADPKPIGTLHWEDPFDQAGGRWTTFGQGAGFGPRGLTIALERVGETGGAVAAVRASAFTFEVAAAQPGEGGEIGASYGILFGYQDSDHYSTAMVNGNGYAQVFSVAGRGAIRSWFPLQQWPHILLGDSPNRLRVDVSGGEGLLRINDEVLMAVPVGEGGVGVIARASADGQQVRFIWARFWGK